MIVEQAVFTSQRNGGRQGYHLVDRSPGIDNALARRLARWCPTHGAILDQDPSAACLSYFVTDRGWNVVTRTVYGGPEYSGRGSLQVYTSVLALTRAQMQAYGSNPLNVLQTAQLVGLLRYRAAPAEGLEAAELPDAPPGVLDQRADQTSMAHRRSSQWLSATLAALDAGRRVALIGVADPRAALWAVEVSLTPRRREQISFASGLRPSQHRPAQLQVLPLVNADIRAKLSAEKVELINVHVEAPVVA